MTVEVEPDKVEDIAGGMTVEAKPEVAARKSIGFILQKNIETLENR